MKRLIQTIKNIFKIEELRKRIGYTVLLLLVYRLGSFIVIPGIDSTMIANMQDFSQEGLVGLLNMFSGGAFGNASIFALGVMPYISASIVIQLLGVFVPYFKKLQMEGESGRRKMNQLTRYLTILILCIQGPAYMAALHNQIPEEAFIAIYRLGWSSFVFNLVSTVILIGGSLTAVSETVSPSSSWWVSSPVCHMHLWQKWERSSGLLSQAVLLCWS